MEEVFLAASQLSVSTSIPQRAVSRSSGNRVYEDSDYEDDSLLPLHGKTPVEVERSKLQPTITGQLAALTWKRKLKIFSEPIFTSAQVMYVTRCFRPRIVFLLNRLAEFRFFFCVFDLLCPQILQLDLTPLER